MDELYLYRAGNEIAQKVIDAFENVLEAVLAKEKNVHGELSVAKAILGGEPMAQVRFDVSAEDATRAENEAIRFRALCERLEQEQPPVAYMAVKLEDGRASAVFLEKDMDRVQEIMKDMNLIRDVAVSKKPGRTKEKDKTAPER